MGVTTLAAGTAYIRREGDGSLRAGLRRVAPGAYETAKRVARAARKEGGSAALAAAITAPEPAAPIERADEPLVVFTDAPAEGWQDWSWADRKMDHSVGRGGSGRSIRMISADWKAVYLHRDSFGTDGYGSVELYVQGQKPGKAGRLTLAAADNGGKFVKQVNLEAGGPNATTVGGGWVRYRVPLSALGISRGWQITGFAIQDGTGSKTGAPILIDDISVLPDPSLPTAPTRATVAVRVNLSAPPRKISSFIYGMAFAPKSYMTDLRLAVNRWGGNDKSRYNWELGNSCNAARDWEFRNRKVFADIADLPEGPSSAADWFIRENRAAGAISLMTVPTIGWVARDDANDHQAVNVPDESGPGVAGAEGRIASYDPSANRARTSVRSVARSRDARPGEVAQDSWVRHLVGTFGAADKGGVRFYAMDNEPDLWDHTHTDVHPARMGYDDILKNFLDYGTAVKDADPAALITGPVSWGWTGYLYSPKDRGSDNFHTAADRKAHGNTPFLLWFLQQVRRHDEKAGRRTLDVLDIHYYPQGDLYNGNADRTTRERRLRSVRSLYDSAYEDESWIGEPVRLIPRMREWIEQGYPGTRLGITEWNFGAEEDISGGLATADALGVFGREGVFLANFWAFPKENSPTYLAFKLFRNADGAGHGFGEVSLPSTSADITKLSCYAARDASTGDLTLILINKMRKAAVSVPVTFAGARPNEGASGKIFRFSEAQPGKISPIIPAPRVIGDKFQITLPPYSATLVRLPMNKKTAEGDRSR